MGALYSFIIALFRKSLTDFALNDEYKRVKRLGDRLAEIESLIDCLMGMRFARLWVLCTQTRKSARGGRPKMDEVVMVTLLVLAPAVARALLSDLEQGKQVTTEPSGSSRQKGGKVEK
jgi:hypothetical protein